MSLPPAPKPVCAGCLYPSKCSRPDYVRSCEHSVAIMGKSRWQHEDGSLQDYLPVVPFDKPLPQHRAGEKVLQLVHRAKKSSDNQKDIDETLKFLTAGVDRARELGATCAAVVLVCPDGTVSSAYGGGDVKQFTLMGALAYMQHRLNLGIDEQ